jgi:hypothetical protein
MNLGLKYSFTLLVTMLSLLSFSQNETRKWYFGNYAGLDFTTDPPTVLTNNTLLIPEGGASIADTSANLLFYTDAQSIRNKNHAVMSNGAGLLGNHSSTQSSLIIRQPGSYRYYYVFTLDNVGDKDGLRYSIVDLSLSGGTGSVTVKNILLHTPTCEKITGTLHCNGTDVWIVTHDFNSRNFRSHLLTTTGFNTVAVTSSVGTLYSSSDYYGSIKISPNGKKLGSSVYNSNSVFELYDFDNSTGVVCKRKKPRIAARLFTF